VDTPRLLFRPRREYLPLLNGAGGPMARLLSLATLHAAYPAVVDDWRIVPLDFGPHPDVVYDRAPLMTVLTQVRFPPVLSLLSRAGVTGFQEALRREYPVLLPPERVANVSMTDASVGVEASPPVWRMTDSENSWTVGLAVDFFSLETSAYLGIDDFLTRFQRILKALRATVRPAESLRIGLRKVNSISAPDVADTRSLVGMVREEMLGVLAVEKFPAPIAGAFSQLVFEDGLNQLTIRYGANKPNDEKLDFIIDTDYSTEQPYAIDADEAMVGLIHHFSAGSTSFFHWALEEAYKDTLGPRPRQAGLDTQ
jgi:uncharacterized protein (TIGR04255 family)